MKRSDNMEMKKIVMEIADQKELHETLVSLNVKHGGAWTFTVMPFSHETRFYMFKNPSSIPDQYVGLSHNRLAYKGKIRGFAPAAIIREQNRGITCE